LTEDADLFWKLIVHLALTGLPAVLAVLVAVRRGLRDVPLLLCVGLAGSGATAMLAFWAFWADPLVGRASAYVLVLGSVLGIALCRPHRLDRRLLRELVVPLALWAFGSLFVLYLGFLHGGSDQPLAVAATRFSHPLPADNGIPVYFANWYYDHGHSPVPPPFGDWLSSDRPPLQVGYTLAQRPFGWDQTGLQYQVIAVVVQQLWIVAMWALLVAARVRPLARGLAMVAVLVSDVVIVNGFFVWPKLIAATFVLAALAMVMSEGWARWRSSAWAVALFAALCALSMLAHGASAFALIPVLALAALRGLPSWRGLGFAALVALVFLAPWTAYQQWFDPPGDRLVKWQLGGSMAIDDRGAVETIVDSYQQAGLDRTLALKRANVTGMVHRRDSQGAVETAVDRISEGEWGQAIGTLRLPRFFWLLPSLGLLLLGAVAMVVGRVIRPRDGPEWRFALVSLSLCLATAAVWALLMFGGEVAATVIHQGSLVLPMLATCALVVGAYAVWPWFAIALTAINSLLVLFLYVPALTPPAGSSYSVAAALLATIGLAGFGWLALRAEPSPRADLSATATVAG
jgi:hypothetical protein